MSLSYAPPPTASSGALRILKPDYPEEGQHTLAYSTEAYAPTYSTGLLKSTQLQLQAGGQRVVTADVVEVSPPEETALRILEHSINNLNGNDNRELVHEIYGGASFSDLLHQRNSGYGLAGLYGGNGEGPGFSGFNQRPRSTIGSSTGNTNFDLLANPITSLTGINLKNAYNQLNQNDPDDDDDDFDMDD